jgi:hypothetical protein
MMLKRFPFVGAIEAQQTSCRPRVARRASRTQLLRHAVLRVRSYDGNDVNDVRASYVWRLEELDAHRDLALCVLRDDAQAIWSSAAK